DRERCDLRRGQRVLREQRRRRHDAPVVLGPDAGADRRRRAAAGRRDSRRDGRYRSPATGTPGNALSGTSGGSPAAAIMVSCQTPDRLPVTTDRRASLPTADTSGATTGWPDVTMTPARRPSTVHAKISAEDADDS